MTMSEDNLSWMYDACKEYLSVLRDEEINTLIYITAPNRMVTVTKEAISENRFPSIASMHKLGLLYFNDYDKTRHEVCATHAGYLLTTFLGKTVPYIVETARVGPDKIHIDDEVNQGSMHIIYKADMSDMLCKFFVLWKDMYDRDVFISMVKNNNGNEEKPCSIFVYSADETKLNEYVIAKINAFTREVK